MSVLPALAKGLLAGLVGTAAMTISETLEMKLTRRQPSTVPGQVGVALLGLSPRTEGEMESLSGRVHWGHGVAMGAARGLIALTGLGGLAATAAHFAVVWGGDAALYAALGIAPPPWRWRSQELATDLFHKGVYAAATGAAYEGVGSGR